MTPREASASTEHPSPVTPRALAIFRHRDLTGRWIITYDDILAIEREAADATRKEVQRLSEYATHDADCAHYRMEIADCDCGLAAILDSLARPVEEERK